MRAEEGVGHDIDDPGTDFRPDNADATSGGLRGYNRGSDSGTADDENSSIVKARVDAGPTRNGDIHGQQLEGFQFATAQITGPIPAPAILRQYDELVPGTAERWINARNDEVSADSIERLTKSDSRALTIGAVTAPLLALGGLAATVILIVTGHSEVALATAIPAVLAAGAQIVAVGRKPPRSD